MIAAITCVSCNGHVDDCYLIKGKVSNCGDWGKNGKIALVTTGTGKAKADTVQISNGRFKISGKIDYPNWVSLSPVRENGSRPAARFMFFLENEHYSVCIEDMKISTWTVHGGTTNELLEEYNSNMRHFDELFSIASIDQQIKATLTPPDRLEKVLAVRREYDHAVKAYKDSIIKANYPSYFSLFLTSGDLADSNNPDSVLKVIESYLSVPSFKDDPKIRAILDNSKTLGF